MPLAYILNAPLPTPKPFDLSQARALARVALEEANIAAKLKRVTTLAEFVTQAPVSLPALAGAPSMPSLVSPRLLPHRSLASAEGRATLLHAVAHIEFNAIRLALDIVSRFNETTQAFVADWTRVAHEEALHFSLLQNHLHALGFNYGDFVAHNGLWEMAEKTKHDLLARLALVPRTLEARGLDVSPAMRDKLAQAGDHRAAGILAIILRDEIGHVAIGNAWFRHYCDLAQRDPLIAFEELWREHDGPTPRPPFNIQARLEAGFVQEEIDWLHHRASAAQQPR